MFGQLFEFSDLPKVVVLCFLEILLSADNAIVLGVLSKHLSANLQKKALLIGLFSAIFFRGVLLLFASFLLNHPLIQLLGAAYLIFLSARHLIRHRKDSFLPASSPSFWKTVFLVELFDLAFAIDSIVAGVAFINKTPHGATYHPKLWIVYVGGVLGAISIRYAAHFFSKLNQRFPGLEMSAYLMVGWIGIKLVFQAFDLFPIYFPFVFWAVLVLLFSRGFLKRHV
jgi:YkoY family integral membrane protein